MQFMKDNFYLISFLRMLYVSFHAHKKCFDANTFSYLTKHDTSIINVAFNTGKIKGNFSTKNSAQ